MIKIVHENYRTVNTDEKNLTAVSFTDALLFQGQQCNSIGAVKLTAVRFFLCRYNTEKKKKHDRLITAIHH
jgi:hypothetical protein